VSEDRDFAPAGWYGDPFGRHKQRYWDGARWCDGVRNGSFEGVDPPGDRPEYEVQFRPADSALPFWRKAAIYLGVERPLAVAGDHSVGRCCIRPHLLDR
jgi:hypothetical protein